nr:MAG TPA: hypothetical protein [Caudoviricetes sp.]
MCATSVLYRSILHHSKPLISTLFFAVYIRYIPSIFVHTVLVSLLIRHCATPTFLL